MKWFVYIPEEGDWPIKYEGKSWEKARKTYLRWAGRKRLPAGANVYGMNEDTNEYVFKPGRKPV